VAHADPKREVPDYDGRGNPDAEGGSWPLWIPRVVLSPLYVVNEFVLRRPLGALVRHAERERWADTVVNLFTFGKGGRNVMFPTALFDFGLLPSVGFYYAGVDVFATGNTMSFHAATWGPKWVNVTMADRYTIDPEDSVQARFELKRSVDNLFFGIGPDITSDGRSRYGLGRVEGSLRYRRGVPSHSHVDVEAGVHRFNFIEGNCCDDPSLDQRLSRREVERPPGYRETYSSAFAKLETTFETRRPRPEPGGGLFAHAMVQPSFDLENARSWIAYGGSAGAAVDLTGHRRTLRFQLGFDFVDSMSGDTIPFIEYPMLGGVGMPGFLPGWMTDRSTAVAQLGYSWPIWLGLDAQTRLSIGNAFGEHLDGFAARRLRLSGDVGFSTSSGYDQGFEVLVGVGTETFEQGAGITSVRVTLGSRRGF